MNTEVTTTEETETDSSRNNYTRWTNQVYRGLSVLLALYLDPTESELQSGKVSAAEVKAKYKDRLESFFTELRKLEGRTIKPNWIIDEAFEEYYKRTRIAYRKEDEIVGPLKRAILGNEKEYARKVIRDLFNHRNLLENILPETKLALWLNADHFSPVKETERFANKLLEYIKGEFPEAELVQVNYPIGIAAVPAGKVVYLIQENADTIDPKEMGEFRASTFGTGSEEKRKVIKLANQFLHEYQDDKSSLQK